MAATTITAPCEQIEFVPIGPQDGTLERLTLAVGPAGSSGETLVTVPLAIYRSIRAELLSQPASLPQPVAAHSFEVTLLACPAERQVRQIDANGFIATVDRLRRAVPDGHPLPETWTRLRTMAARAVGAPTGRR